MCIIRLLNNLTNSSLVLILLSCHFTAASTSHRLKYPRENLEYFMVGNSKKYILTHIQKNIFILIDIQIINVNSTEIKYDSIRLSSFFVNKNGDN